MRKGSAVNFDDAVNCRPDSAPSFFVLRHSGVRGAIQNWAHLSAKQVCNWESGTAATVKTREEDVVETLGFFSHANALSQERKHIEQEDGM